MKVDGVRELVVVPEAAGQVLYFLDLRVHAFGICVVIVVTDGVQYSEEERLHDLHKLQGRGESVADVYLLRVVSHAYLVFFSVPSPAFSRAEFSFLWTSSKAFFIKMDF